MKNSKIIVVTLMALITVLAFSGCKKAKDNEVKENVTNTVETTEENKKETNAETGDKTEETTKPSAEEEKVFKPTFMYFVSSNDAEHSKNMEVVEKLQKEYKDKVVFDIKNVDDDPEVLQNFEIVKGQTPALIMLNTKNDISNFLFKNGNYDDLKQAIDVALQ